MRTIIRQEFVFQRAANLLFGKGVGCMHGVGYRAQFEERFQVLAIDVQAHEHRPYDFEDAGIEAGIARSDDDIDQAADDADHHLLRPDGVVGPVGGVIEGEGQGMISRQGNAIIIT